MFCGFLLSLNLHASQLDTLYQEMTTLKKNDSLQSYQLSNLNNESVTLNHSGKPVLISVFTTWCGVCKVELKDLNDIYHSWSDQDRPFDVVVVNAGESVKSVSKYKRRRQLDLPILIDHDLSFIKDINALGTPTLLLFDKKNKLVFQGSELPKEWLMSQKKE